MSRQEWHRRPVAARRRFRIELLAFPPFPPAPRASLPPVGAVSRHPYLATVVGHIRARPHNPARRMLPTPKNRNQMMVSRIHTCPRSLPRRSARNAIRVAVLRQAVAQGMGGKPKEGRHDASAADQRPDGKTPDHL
jgi:hypothetical protein